jgi:hypothetical protein
MPTYASWIQTTDYTCSESSLMCALNELTGSGIDSQTEVGIWTAMLPCYLKPLEKLLQEKVGTPPHCLARYIQRNRTGVTCEYFVYGKRTKGLGSKSFLIGFLSAAHDIVMAMLMWLKPGARYSLRKQDDTDVLALLDRKPGCRLLLVIVIPGGYVHFVMVRRGTEKGTVVVMDPFNHKDKIDDYLGAAAHVVPGEGANFSYTDEQFACVFGPRLYGYSMRLTGRV